MKPNDQVYAATKRGELVKQPCEVCGTTQNVHAHHDDYKKPLEVRWLCAKDHVAWHREFGPGKNKGGQKSQDFKFRVDDAELGLWRCRANEVGMTLSAWIRSRCEGEDAVLITSHPPKISKSGVADKRVVRRNGGVVGAIKDLAHEGLRKHVAEVSVDSEIARRLGHEVGCDCWRCVQAARFSNSLKKPVAAAPKKNRR